jgi:ubiquinone/menaquinone biosynthesis C-methylase UbiE
LKRKAAQRQEAKRMMDDPQAYRKLLLEKAYADEHAMMVRKKMHDQYSNPHVDMPAWVLDRYHWKGSESVLDIGSGPGTYLDALLPHIGSGRYAAGDLSHGMLKSIKARGDVTSIAVMDAETLPFANNSFDVVLANHMLYHVGDVERAIKEFRRVMRDPKSMLIIATSSEYTMPEFNTLMQRAIRLLRQGAADDMIEQSSLQNFSLESGTSILARYFPSVVRYDIPGAIIFPDTEPVIEYFESSRPFYELRLPEGIFWEEFITIMANQVGRLIEHFGELVVSKVSGAILATEDGGFAEEFRQRLAGS